MSWRTRRPTDPKSSAAWLELLREAQCDMTKKTDEIAAERRGLLAKALTAGEDCRETLKKYDHRLVEYQKRVDKFDHLIVMHEHRRQLQLRQKGEPVTPTPLHPAKQLSYGQTFPASALALVDRKHASGPLKPADWVGILSFARECVAKKMDEIAAERRQLLAKALTAGEDCREALGKFDYRLVEYQKRLDTLDHLIVSYEHRRQRQQRDTGTSAPAPPLSHPEQQTAQSYSDLADALIRGERLPGAEEEHDEKEEEEEGAASADGKELSSERTPLLSGAGLSSDGLRRRAHARSAS